MAFYLYSGNQPEELSKSLARDFYAARRDDFFSPARIVIQSRGMADFVREEIAGYCGIAINLELPFLTRFIYRVIEDNLPERPDFLAFEPGELRWRIFRILHDNPDSYPEAAEYWHDRDSGDELLFGLSCQLAELFDHYQHHAPDLLKRWRQEEEKSADYLFPDFAGEQETMKDGRPVPAGKAAAARWEKRLYLALRREGIRSMDEYFEDFFQLKHLAVKPSDTAVFGISSMPEIFLDFFCRLSRECDIFFYYANYCRTYWGDVFTLEDRRRITAAAKKKGVVPEFPESENPLLENFAGAGRDFFRAVLDRADRCEMIYLDLHSDIAAPGALGELQRGVLDMLPEPACPEDESVSIHNCRGCRREVELIHDQILKAIEDGVEPREILVMTPDIEKYSPYINAVFSGSPLAESYRISDLEARDSNAVGDTFSRMLSLVGSRYESNRIFEFFSSPPVAEKFDFSSGDLDKLRDFLIAGKYCWGENAQTRKEFCQVPFDNYSYASFRDRSMAGYAMGEDADDFALPGEVLFSPGEDAGLAGRFFEAANRLFQLLGLLRDKGRAEADEYLDIFENLLNEFFSDGENYFRETAELRRAADNLRNELKKADFHLPVSFEVIREAFNPADGQESGGVFLRGKITFCSLKPMRSIPRKVIAVMGLAEGMFPRRDRNGSLNLSSLGSGRVTRSMVLEDRFLFLEAIMAARQKLILSYPGMSETDDLTIPPAPPLFELMEMVPKAPRLNHFIQSSDVRYFLEDWRKKGYFSYSKPDFEAAKAKLEKNGGDSGVIPEKVFPPEAFPAPEIESVLPEHLSLEALHRFFANPAAHFLANRAMLKLNSADEAVFSDLEPMTLNGLEDYTARKKLFELYARGFDLARIRPRLKNGDFLPPGRAGDETFETIAAEEAARIRIYSFIRSAAARTPFSYRMLAGNVENMIFSPETRFVFVFTWSKFRAKDYLLLLLSTALAAADQPEGENISPPGIKTCGLLFSRDGIAVCRFNSGAEASAYLDTMLEFYRTGQDRILYFLPSSSFSMLEGKKLVLDERENSGNIFNEEIFFTPSTREIAEQIFHREGHGIESFNIPENDAAMAELLENIAGNASYPQSAAGRQQ